MWNTTSQLLSTEVPYGQWWWCAKCGFSAFKHKLWLFRERVSCEVFEDHGSFTSALLCSAALFYKVEVMSSHHCVLKSKWSAVLRMVGWSAVLWMLNGAPNGEVKDFAPNSEWCFKCWGKVKCCALNGGKWSAVLWLWWRAVLWMVGSEVLCCEYGDVLCFWMVGVKCCAMNAMWWSVVVCPEWWSAVQCCVVKWNMLWRCVRSSRWKVQAGVGDTKWLPKSVPD